MSLAWEITVEDVAIVLMRESLNADPDELFNQHFAGDTEHCGRVERAVLACTDFNDQCDAALNEIEAILTEVGVIPSEWDTKMEKHESIWVANITVTDPETKLPVEVEIRKDLETGAMVGLDSSFLAQMDEQDTVCDPYNPGQCIEIPDDET